MNYYADLLNFIIFKGCPNSTKSKMNEKTVKPLKHTSRCYRLHNAHDIPVDCIYSEIWSLYRSVWRILTLH